MCGFEGDSVGETLSVAVDIIVSTLEQRLLLALWHCSQYYVWKLFKGE